MVTEPRSLDPALMQNSVSTNALLGNALYGTLMVNDVKTGEVKYKMAESFTSKDEGKTFELKLRQGLTFSDGTPLDAQAVKFNWDRIKDPATASISVKDAAAITSTEVVDARTLKVGLRAPIPRFAQVVIPSSLNWIASPKSLQGDQRAFDAKPVGAGPFTLKSWIRQNRIELAKNPRYWDQPKPYLDGMTLRTVLDSTQRLNTLTSGGADLMVDTNWANIAKARGSGLSSDVVPLSGGQGLTMNTRRPPFNDVRARQAIAAAIDLKAVDVSVFQGKGQIPTTLFTESSPFFANMPLVRADKATAQRLFDQLAAEGKKVSFTFTAYSTREMGSVAQSVQAQLSAFRNVEVKIRTIDLAEVPSVYAANSFDMLISAALLVDPEPQLWEVFHGQSRANRSGINDPQLNEALDKGRTATSLEERKAAYQTAQQRLAELVPTLFYTRASYAADSADSVHGVTQYGFGSLLPEELWIKK